MDNSESSFLQAVEAFNKGDLMMAKLLAEKANSIIPKQKYEELIKECNSKINILKQEGSTSNPNLFTDNNKSDKNNNNSEEIKKVDNENTKKDGSSSQNNTNTNEKLDENNKANEDQHLCQEIIGKKDYYEILSIKKNPFDENELKKQYKKLALRFHPDKNKSPLATDAFKKVTQAYCCLSDNDKKAHYDIYGAEKEQMTREQRNGQEEMDPQELFDYLFFGKIPKRRNVRVPRTTHVHYQQNPI